jgi:hypothetical protein
MIAPKVHPELLDQLNRAGSGLVQAVLQMQSPGNPSAKLSPEDAAALADQVLTRVAGHLGRKPARHNLLRNLATLIVEADPEFLNSLIQQPEIRSALPNKTADSPFIPPKGKRPV